MCTLPWIGQQDFLQCVLRPGVITSWSAGVATGAVAPALAAAAASDANWRLRESAACSDALSFAMRRSACSFTSVTCNAQSLSKSCRNLFRTCDATLCLGCALRLLLPLGAQSLSKSGKAPFRVVRQRSAYLFTSMTCKAKSLSKPYNPPLFERVRIKV